MKNNEKKVEVTFTETQLKMLAEFLNRVEYKGLQEVMLIQSILDSVKQSKIIEENNSDEKE